MALINHHQCFSIHFQYTGMKGSPCPTLVWGRKGLGAPTSQGNGPTGAVGDGVQLITSLHCSFGAGSLDA